MRKLWTIELAGQSRTIELVADDFGAASVSVDSEAIYSRQASAIALPPRSFSMQWRGHSLTIRRIDLPGSVKFLLDVDGQSHAATDAPAPEAPKPAARRAAPTTPTDDRRRMSYAFVAIGGVLALQVAHQWTTRGSLYPVVLIGAAALLPYGIAIQIVPSPASRVPLAASSLAIAAALVFVIARAANPTEALVPSLVGVLWSISVYVRSRPLAD